MLDPGQLRNDFPRVAAQLKRRGFDLERSLYRQAEEHRKTLQVQVEELRNRRKRNAKEIGEARSKGDDAAGLLRAADEIKQQIGTLEQDLAEAQRRLNEVLLGIPNCLEEGVPDGDDESGNVEIRQWGKPPRFAFEARDHMQIVEGLGLVDSEAAAALSGSRFVVMYGSLAKLQRALIRFMLDLHTRQHGYREVYVPYLVHAAPLLGTGQLPRFASDLFKTTSGHYLIPTAEVPMTNLCQDRILEEHALPLKWVSHTPCFRSEAGSYGKDTRGLIRQHQFEKVEMVQIVRAEDSPAALNELVGHAEAVLQALELPYRLVELCAGDLGFSAARTYDLEVWLPGQERYREISSCSNTRDFQARRMKARMRDSQGKTALVHTLNGSGLAAGRALVAVLENNQDAQGHVRVPAALVPYMDGQEIIGPDSQ